MLIKSRFAYAISRNDVYAFFNALRLKPTFLPDDLAQIFIAKDRVLDEEIRHWEQCEPELTEAVAALTKNRYFVPNNEFDDQSIQYFQNIIGAPYISVAYLMLSDRCNFDCAYCFVKRGMPEHYEPRDMSIETASAAVDCFARLTSLDANHSNCEKTLIFYGGEPLLNIRALKAALARVSDLRQQGKLPGNLQLSLISNGSLLNHDIAEILKEHEVSISISLDGDKVINDTFRTRISGGSAHASALDAVRICQKIGLNWSLSVTLTEEVLAKRNDILDYLLRFDGLRGLGFNMLMSGSAPRSHDYSSRASKFMLEAFSQLREKGIYEDRLMRKANAFAESKVYACDCAASGGNQIVIAPDGAVGICHGLIGTREYFCSTVFDANFNPVESGDFLEWNRRSPLHMEECKSCFALGICGGGCPLNALKDHGTIFALDNAFCIHAKMTFEWFIWDLYRNCKNDR